MFKPCVLALVFTLAAAAPVSPDACIHFLPALWPRTGCLRYTLPNAACEVPSLSVSHLDVIQPQSGIILKARGSTDSECPQGWQHVDEYQCSADNHAIVVDRTVAACVVTTTYRSPGACGVETDSAYCAPIPVPTPTAEQLKYQLSELVALTHFNMATYGIFQGCTDLNWLWLQYPRTFHPGKLNVSNWIQSYQDFGAKSAVLTAKHGCGFTMWPTQTTLPNGTQYPYTVFGDGSIGVDVISEFVNACEAANIGHGFYYSFPSNFYLNVQNSVVGNSSSLQPGMANVTQAEFEAIALAQVHELWSQYGNLTEIWFDGGYQPEVKQKLTAMLAELQPQAVAFGGVGVSNNPLRWVGTESGNPPYPIWSTGCDGGAGDPTSTQWCPATADTTLQWFDLWFYIPLMPVRELATLIQVYHSTVGQNAVMELDFAIDLDGLVDPTHAQRYKEFGDWIRACYDTPIARTSGNSTAVMLLRIPSSSPAIDRVWVREDQTFGQRIRAYTVDVLPVNSTQWLPFSNGTSVGNKHITIVSAPVQAAQFRLTISAAIAPPVVADFAAFAPCPSS